MQFIRHIIDPDELYLCWMAIDESIRKRFLVGKLTRASDGNVSLQYFYDDPQFFEAKKHGFQGFPAFPKAHMIYNTGVLDAFLKRLPPRNRLDFKDYAAWYGIGVESIEIMSDFALLGYTGAKVADDGFSLVHPFNTNKPFEFLLEVAGFRHKSDVPAESIKEGAEVNFVPEPENPEDPYAIKILLSGNKIGYVDRGRLKFMHEWLKQDRTIQGHIARINGTSKRTLIFIRTEVSALGVRRTA